jgi:hypothetical protein
MAKRKGQTTISKAMHRILKTEKHEQYKEPGINTVVPEE